MLSCVVRASGGEAHSHLSCVRMVTVPSLGGGLEAKNILFVSAAAVPGAVPALTNAIKHYDGEVMAPFAPEFHLNF